MCPAILYVDGGIQLLVEPEKQATYLDANLSKTISLKRATFFDGKFLSCKSLPRPLYHSVVARATEYFCRSRMPESMESTWKNCLSLHANPLEEEDITTTIH